MASRCLALVEAAESALKRPYEQSEKPPACSTLARRIRMYHASMLMIQAQTLPVMLMWADTILPSYQSTEAAAGVQSLKAVKTAGVATEVHDGFSVLWTADARDTCRLYGHITAALQVPISAHDPPPPRGSRFEHVQHDGDCVSMQQQPPKDEAAAGHRCVACYVTCCTGMQSIRRCQLHHLGQPTSPDRQWLADVASGSPLPPPPTLAAGGDSAHRNTVQQCIPGSTQNRRNPQHHTLNLACRPSMTTSPQRAARQAPSSRPHWRRSMPGWRLPRS